MNAKTSPSAGNTWRDLPAAQQPEYPDTEALRAVIADLESYPPLVFAGECDQLRARMAAVAEGEAFLLQGGDCAEAFDAVSADHELRRMIDGCEADGALVFTCNGRGAALFGEPHHDASVVSEALDAAPLAGMFCAGELGPIGGQTFVHGFTASIVSWLMLSLRSCHFARLPSSSGFDSYFALARLRSLNSPSSAMIRPPILRLPTLVLSAAGFIATSTSGASPAVSIDEEPKLI